MGKLVNGKWVVADVATSSKSGAYERIPRSFREFIHYDHPIFKPESERYHLYISYACPWAQRTLIFRKLKDLEKHITMSIVSPDMLDEGWEFDPCYPGSTEDHLYGVDRLREIYLMADPIITTSVTVPVLWDKKTQTIVNNESSEIIRMFNSSFNELTGNDLNFYPKELEDQIDRLNELIYESVNNGVYRTGFAKTQKVYDKAAKDLFSTLDKLDDMLEQNKYLLGDTITEVDLRLIPTLLRFDLVYYTHFKCNLKRIKDYKNLFRYVSDLFELDAIKNTTNFEHIKRHYYYSHDRINPYRIIPIGPDSIL
jgi:putative glutathione S-transferase